MFYFDFVRVKARIFYLRITQCSIVLLQDLVYEVLNYVQVPFNKSVCGSLKIT